MLNISQTHFVHRVGAKYGHQGSVSLLNITQTHFVHRVGAEFGHLGRVSFLNITQTHFVHRGHVSTCALYIYYYVGAM